MLFVLSAAAVLFDFFASGTIGGIPVFSVRVSLMSLRQACRTVSLSRTVYFYRPDTRRDEPVIHDLQDHSIVPN